MLFRDSYDEARAKRYHDLTPANHYNVDYSIFGTTVVEDVLKPIRHGA
jgi:glutamine synthetase